MINSIKIAIFTIILGTLSSGIGGIIVGLINIKNKKLVYFLYQLTAGIMTGIVCFEMLPQSFEIANIFSSIFGVIVGIMLIYFLDIIVIKLSKKNKRLNIVSVVVIISMAFHNAIEGLAMGASFAFSISFGIIVILSIFLHDIPEGMVVAITNKVDKKNNKNSIILSGIVGSFVGVGCFIGNYFGNTNNYFISFCLSIASGTMLYIVSCELIPESCNNTKNKFVYVAYILGILLGAIMSKI